jgi:hypothetical protein
MKISSNHCHVQNTKLLLRACKKQEFQRIKRALMKITQDKIHKHAI